MRLILATSNPGKLQEMQAYLTAPTLNCDLILKPQDLEIEETGTTFLENARLKASQVAQALGEWSIADDSGLQVDALNGAPGLYSARYGTTDQNRIDRLLTELSDTPNRRHLSRTNPPCSPRQRWLRLRPHFLRPRPRNDLCRNARRDETRD
jgi:XTP/dITP diphosphohydrolase